MQRRGGGTRRGEFKFELQSCNSKVKKLKRASSALMGLETEIKVLRLTKNKKPNLEINKEISILEINKGEKKAEKSTSKD